jgi:hypothetical protein
MVMNNEFEMMWKEVVVDNFQAPCRNLSRETEEDNEKSRSG